MLDASTILVAWLSMFASGFTIRFTMFRRGTVRMAQPAFVMFAMDSDTTKPKLAVDAHLYTTAQRGAIIEAIFARVTRGTATQDFDVWVYGKRSDSLTRGSAVHVGQQGVTAQHHFLLPAGASGFGWSLGDYTVEFFGTVVGRSRLHRFWQLHVRLDEKIDETNDCVFFDWRPALKEYEAHALPRRERRRRDTAVLRDPILNGVGRGSEEGDDE